MSAPASWSTAASSTTKPLPGAAAARARDNATDTVDEGAACVVCSRAPPRGRSESGDDAALRSIALASSHSQANNCLYALSARASCGVAAASICLASPRYSRTSASTALDNAATAATCTSQKLTRSHCSALPAAKRRSSREGRSLCVDSWRISTKRREIPIEEASLLTLRAFERFCATSTIPLTNRRRMIPYSNRQRISLGWGNELDSTCKPE
jgi:hypothetical protein